MRLRLVLLWLGATCSGASAAAGLSDLGTLARTILGANQGVYIEAADGSVLLSQAANLAVQPASISKVPTTLALLRKLGPDYRFVTTFAAAGPVRGGMLDGDLVVDSGGDPYSSTRTHCSLPCGSMKPACSGCAARCAYAVG